MIPCYAVMNRPADNEFYNNFSKTYQNILLGEIPFDENVLNYDYVKTNTVTKDAMKNILEKIKGLKKRSSLTS